ncbi:MAG: hypothetical protein R3E32_13975 [Chitinophagales bacterium]
MYLYLFVNILKLARHEQTFYTYFFGFLAATSDWVVGQEMVLVKEDIGTVNNLNLLASEQIDDQWFFMEADAANNDLWLTDGTEEGTKKLLEDNVFAFRSRAHLYMGSYQGMLYFAATDAEHGVEVWRSDGTVEGTKFFADLAEGTENSHPAGFVELNGQLYIWAYIKKEDGATYSQVWRTDGTNVEMIKEISVCENTFNDYEFTLKEYTINQNDILFTLGAESGGVQFCLWKTDGTSEGTMLVTETSTADGPVGLITAENNISYFIAIAQVENLISNFLWRSDGTSSGTYPLKPGVGVRKAGNQLYFFYQPDFFDDNIEIWVTEGSENTTNLVKILPLPSYGSLIGFQEKLFFVFDDEEHGREFWVSDGTETGTTILTDINVGEGDSNPRSSIVVGDYLYFIANKNVEKFLKPYQSHHINPVDLFNDVGGTESTFLFMFKTLEDKMNSSTNSVEKANLKKKLELRRDFFGGFENGIMLPHKRGVNTIHASHPNYTTKIRNHMKAEKEKLEKTGDYDDDELLADALFKEAEKIAKGIREELIEQCLLGNKNVNEVLDNYTF